MTSSVTPDIKDIKIEKIAKISKVAKAAKKVVKHISSEKSSLSESSILSKSLTEDNKTQSIVDKVLMFVKHPKFKWVVIGVILIALALGYFKYQQKLKAAKKQLDKADVKPSDQDLLKQQLLKQQIEMAQIQAAAQQASQMQAQQTAQMQAQQAAQMQAQQMQAQVNQNVVKESMVNTKKGKKYRPPTPSDSSEDSNSSEEVFIEDKNVMRHNLTQEEMNAIDRHLEDVKIDHMHE
jgi:hypothetical protein